MKIGLVSDTHGLFDEALPDLLAGAELIIHAGDVGSQEILNQLGAIAPVRAVRGNIDPEALGLAPSLSLMAEGTQIQVVHSLSVPQGQLESWCGPASLPERDRRERDRFRAAFPAGACLVVFGHSHQAGIYLIQQGLFVNPGSAGRKRFSLERAYGFVTISAGQADVKIISLEDYNLLMTRSIRLGVSAPC